MKTIVFIYRCVCFGLIPAALWLALSIYPALLLGLHPALAFVLAIFWAWQIDKTRRRYCRIVLSGERWIVERSRASG